MSNHPRRSSPFIMALSLTLVMISSSWAMAAPRKKAKAKAKPAVVEEPVKAPEPEPPPVEPVPEAKPEPAAPEEPVAEETPAPTSRTDDDLGIGSLSIGGGVGLDIGGNGYGTGVKFLGNGYYTIKELAPGFLLEAGGHVGFIYKGCDAANVDCSLIVFEVVPAARVRYLLNPELSFYGDGGFGLVLAHASVSIPGYGSTSNNEFGGVLHLAAGVQYRINEHLSVVGEPLGLNVYIHDNSATHFSLMGGVLYRL